MLDIKFIRENKEIVQMGAKKKHIDFNVEELLKVDDERKSLTSSVEEMRATQNEVSKQIPQAEEAKRDELLAEMSILKEKMQDKEDQLKKTMQEWQRLMLQVPNIPDMSVPDGDSDEGNSEIRTWGEMKKGEHKDHIEIMLAKKMVDFDRGAKIAGFRGYFLRGDGALLEIAIKNLVIDRLTKKGFELVTVPSMVNRETLLGTGYLPQGEDDLFKTQDEKYLAGTGEVAMMSFHSGEVLDIADLPKKYLAFSPCFRREIGSHGKDVKGLKRVHEFSKLEQVVLTEASHEVSVSTHEELTKNAEEIMLELEIPYRVVVNCGGDLGLGQVKKYDIEAWSPGKQIFDETHSASYFHDFQSRRLNIKYKDGAGVKRFTHSLNNTAVAFPRFLIGFVENHYDETTGKIRIPEPLQKYLDGRSEL